MEQREVELGVVGEDAHDRAGVCVYGGQETVGPLDDDLVGVWKVGRGGQDERVFRVKGRAVKTGVAVPLGEFARRRPAVRKRAAPPLPDVPGDALLIRAGLLQ